VQKDEKKHRSTLNLEKTFLATTTLQNKWQLELSKEPLTPSAYKK
jgi:hypothetical protein